MNEQASKCWIPFKAQIYNCLRKKPPFHLEHAVFIDACFVQALLVDVLDLYHVLDVCCAQLVQLTESCSGMKI